MKVPINLASEPFRRDRPLIAGSVAVGLLLIGMLGVLSYLAASERARAAEARAAISRTESQLSALAKERARLDATLRQQQNAEVLENSIFLNQLIARKGVSWTRIFSDLEQVTPPNVRVITVRPQINANNELLLDMVVGSQSVESIQNFVMQLESSALFGKTFVYTTVPPSQTEPLYRSRITVNYAQKL
jgi:type IV pilus assembly protein PilN